jgi:hypothetical protein
MLASVRDDEIELQVRIILHFEGTPDIRSDCDCVYGSGAASCLLAPLS